MLPKLISNVQGRDVGLGIRVSETPTGDDRTVAILGRILDNRLYGRGDKVSQRTELRKRRGNRQPVGLLSLTLFFVYGKYRGDVD